MEVAEYKNIYDNENTHFFYVSTHYLIISIIKQFYKNKKIKILDAGCGTGLLAKKMQLFGEVIGVDLNPEALYFAKKRGIKVVKSSIEKLPFKDAAFDIVVSIDVLTHKLIADDLIPLREFHRVLKPGGILILRVSANRWLKLNHDKHVLVTHRYEETELENKLSKAGFKTEKISFVDFSLFIPIVIKHLWEKILKPKETRSAIGKINPIINTLMTKILLFEANLFNKIHFPFGIGLIAISKKSI